MGTSERVCFERSYPFEQRYLTYAYDLARMVALPGQHDAQWNNEVMFQGRSPVVGCLPYANVGCLDRAELSHALFRSNWDQFSIAMRKKASLPMEALAYYAEKAPSHVADLANEMFKGKNIFLLRDPRDELVSIKSFNRKRGFNSFGWVDTDTDMSFATKMCKVRGRFMRHLLEMKPDHRRIMVRYEDLIENQQADGRSPVRMARPNAGLHEGDGGQGHPRKTYDQPGPKGVGRTLAYGTR